jgi:hypothetical protein
VSILKEGMVELCYLPRKAKVQIAWEKETTKENGGEYGIWMGLPKEHFRGGLWECGQIGSNFCAIININPI